MKKGENKTEDWIDSKEQDLKKEHFILKELSW